MGLSALITKLAAATEVKLAGRVLVPLLALALAAGAGALAAVGTARAFGLASRGVVAAASTATTTATMGVLAILPKCAIA